MTATRGFAIRSSSVLVFPCFFRSRKIDKNLVAEEGRASESLVAEAVDRMLSYDLWFVAEVEKGIAAAAVAT
jgi:hypothetical protein